MTLHDFATPTVPGIAWGRNVDLAPIRAWIDQGLLHEAGTSKPDALSGMLSLTEAGEKKCGIWKPRIDRSRWSFQCGKIARRGKEPSTAHTLEPGSDCHRHWLAGWEEG